MKKILILLLFGLLAFGIYYGYTEYYRYKSSFAISQTVKRDKAFSGLKIETVMDSNGIGFYVNADWVCRLDNTANSSAYIEIVTTRTGAGSGKKVIARSNTIRNLLIGTLSCYVIRKDIRPDQPYVWVKINSVIDKIKQKPIVQCLGKYN